MAGYRRPLSQSDILKPHHRNDRAGRQCGLDKTLGTIYCALLVYRGEGGAEGLEQFLGSTAPLRRELAKCLSLPFSVRREFRLVYLGKLGRGSVQSPNKLSTSLLRDQLLEGEESILSFLLFKIFFHLL